MQNMKNNLREERLKAFAEMYEKNVETSPTRKVLAFHAAMRAAGLKEQERNIAKVHYADGTIGTLLSQ
jgi:hypothetical protein